MAAIAPAQSVLGRVTNSQGKAVAGARILFRAADLGWPPWQETQARALRVTQTDARGRFRIDLGTGDAAVSGVLMADHRDHGGSLVLDATAGIPIAVRLEPTGRVVVAGLDRSTPFRLWLRALRPNTQSTLLEARQSVERPESDAAAIELPAGEYLALLDVDGRRIETHCRVVAGATTTLAAPPVQLPRATMAAPPDADPALRLALWPEVPLVVKRDPETQTCSVDLPASRGIVRVLEVSRTGATARAFREFGVDGRAGLVDLGRDATGWHTITLVDEGDGSPVQGADLFLIEHQGRGRRVVSRSQSDANGLAQIAGASITADGAHQGVESDSRLLVVLRTDGPPITYPLSEVVEAQRLAVPARPARSLIVRVEGFDPITEPPARVQLDQEPWGTLVRTAYTNARGEAYFERLSDGVARLQANHALHQPVQREVSIDADGRTVLTVAPGYLLSGRVTRGGQPAPGVVVELRDASGTAGTATRLVATDADGRFDFPGLPNAPFTVFAQSESEGTTWSARWSGLRPTRGVEIELVSEDPPLPGQESTGTADQTGADGRAPIK